MPPRDAHAGASEVLLLDREPLALQCALLNASLNGLPIAGAPAAAAASGAGATGSCSSDGGGGGVEGDDCSSSSSVGGDRSSSRAGIPSLHEVLPHLAPADAARLQRRLSQREQPAGRGQRVGRVAAQAFDWSRPAALEPPDVVLLSDCLYAAPAVQGLAAAVPRLLPHAGGQLILADPEYRARSNRERFLRMLCKGSGFAVEAAEERWAPRTAGSGNRGASDGGREGHDSSASAEHVPIVLLHLRRKSCTHQILP